jgi:hypothetical protein
MLNSYQNWKHFMVDPPPPFLAKNWGGGDKIVNFGVFELKKKIL